MSAQEEAVKQGKMTGSSRCWWWGRLAAAEPESLTGNEVKNFWAGIRQHCVFKGAGGVWELQWPIFGGGFGREETFAQHKYAVALNSIFPNLSLLAMLL